MEKIPCPDCEAEIDYEIGPDENMEDILDTAQLPEIRAKRKTKKMDSYTKSAIWVEDCNWI